MAGAGSGQHDPRQSGYHSMPRWPFWPESNGCLILVISVTSDAASIKQLLVDQIVSPVHWEDTMVKLIGATAAGEAKYVELSPGRTLAGLAKRINRRLPVESVEA